MSEPTSPVQGSGGMSSAGTTNPLRTSGAQLDIFDKSVLCGAICKCKDSPAISVNGRSLKQVCVSKSLKVVDQTMDHQSPYKPEVNYDMSKHPPAPIMDSKVGTKVHDWLPGWIGKYWDGDYVAGVGLVRRPDVIIVKDAGKPPTQDNIKNVVEIKFPPEVVDERQQMAYEDIAGDKNKVSVIGPDDCNCSSGPDLSTIPAPNASSLTAGALLLMILGFVLAP